MAARKDRADGVLKAAWIRAWREGRLEIKLPDAISAGRTQFALYRAVKEAKEGRDENGELERAAASVMLTKKDNSVILIRRDTLSEIEAVARAMGVRVEDFADPTKEGELEAEESQVRLLEKLKGDAP